MPRVSGCCCFSLKTGTIIIATLGWICALFTVVGFIVLAASFSDVLHKEEIDTLYYKLGLGVVSFIVYVLLFVGVLKKNSDFFLPYLTLLGLACVGNSISTGICFVLIFFYGMAAVAAFLSLACVSAFMWYFWIVVYSYYHEIRAEIVRVPTTEIVQYSLTSNCPPSYEKDITQFA